MRHRAADLVPLIPLQPAGADVAGLCFRSIALQLLSKSCSAQQATLKSKLQPESRAGPPLWASHSPALFKRSSGDDRVIPTR